MNKHASMNRIFRLVWNESLDAYVPVAETARGRGKSSKRKLIAAALSLSAGIAQAGPTGGQVAGGSGTITQSGSTTTIQQSSENLSLNWQTFNIAPQETVDFVQPNVAAIAVNRILGTNGSVILGHLNANGQVYLINPNGVLFGKGAEVNVGGLVASTLGLNEGMLGAASKTFTGPGTGSIVNDGTLTATGGTVALLGNHVSNNGVILAQLGTVALGAGSAATLTFAGTHLVSMQVDQSVLNSVASNGGLIRADGGQVLMSAGAQKALLASVVNNTGVIEARTLENHEGTITLLGGMSAGTVNVGGTLDASARDGGHGGAIETSAEHVEVANEAKVTTAAAMGLSGTWTIDPQDLTIAATNGDMTGAALTASLANGNIALQSSSGATAGSGNINVNDAVSWHAHTLTLTAANNVNVNAVMTVTGSGSIDLEPATANGSDVRNANGTVLMALGPTGFGGRIDFNSTGTVVIEGSPYSVITTLAGLQAMGGSGDFVLGANIDASATSSWNSGHGFVPVGFVYGAFDGLGHVISNLAVHPAHLTLTNTGLISSTYGTPIRNVGLVNANVSGDGQVGGLVGKYQGYLDGSQIFNSYVTGSVSGTGSNIGGLVGKNYGNITNSFSTATVSGAQGDHVGGLVGLDAHGSISQTYATGNITSFGQGGGLVGGTYGQGSIANSFATGAVSGSGSGGLVGQDYGPVTKSYSTGAGVGLIGTGSAAVTASYWDVQTSGVGTAGSTAGSHGGTGESTAWMKTASNFTSVGWNLTPITGVWGQSAAVNNGYPYLCNLMASCLPVVYIEALTGSSVYGTSPVIGYELVDGSGNAYSLTAATVGGTVAWSGAPTHVSNVGSYSVTYGSGLSISGADASDYTLAGWQTPSPWTVTPATLSFSPLAATRQYNGTALNNSGYSRSLANYAVSGYVNGDSSSDISVTLSGSLAFNGAVGTNVSHAGSYALSAGTLGASLAGDAAGNYTFAFTNPLANAIVITPAALTVSGSTVGSKVYDGTTVATISGGTPAGVYVGDSVTLAQAGTFASKNAAPSIAVTANDTLSGTNAGDYTLIEPTGLSGSIAPATLTVSGTTVASKVYNGTTVASLTGGSLVGLISGDTVTLAQAGTFASKNVGTGIAVSAGDALGGASAGNYILVDPIGLAGNITPATLTVSGTSVGSKVYNGTTAASLTGGSLVGIVSGDSVTLNQSGMFASATAGTGIAVTATDTVSGASSIDYSIAEPTGLTGSILPAASLPPPGGSNSPVSAAMNTSTQVVESLIYPQLGANPQAINASPTIAVLATSDGGASDDAAGSHRAIAVNVSMKIGANGTLKIENGGLRLPSNLVIGNE